MATGRRAHWLYMVVAMKSSLVRISLLFFVVVFGGGGGWLFYRAHCNSVTCHMARMGLKTKLTGFNVQVAEGKSGDTVTYLTLIRPQERIEIKRVHGYNPKQAQQFFEDERRKIGSTFNPISRKSKCGSKFIPNQSGVAAQWAEWGMLADERGSYGLCEWDRAFYLYNRLLRYCAADRVLAQIDYYRARGSRQQLPKPKLFEKISCLRKSVKN